MGSLSNPNAYSGIVKNSDSGGSGFPVNITDPQEGQILTFDSENEEWVNRNTGIKVVTLNRNRKTATQEDVDNYQKYYDINLGSEADIEVGVEYTVEEIPANFNEISNYAIVVVIEGNFSTVANNYGFEDPLYGVYMADDSSSIEYAFYSLNANVNLRRYTK